MSRTLVMGILNITPDSFADGGKYLSKEDAIKDIFIQHLQAIDSTQYEGKRVVVKGCGDILIPEYAYVEVSKKLLPVVKSLMYGEPCSTVPVFKRK